jgi:hypothetical protein
VTRLFLALWLAAFAVQMTDILPVVVPDGCSEETRGSTNDPCRDACPRCLCCARVPIFVPQVAQAASTPVGAIVPMPPVRDRVLPPLPHAIFHVPKHS